ncbi:cystatin-1-like [Thamnophis elegans]|uniref:cystatin-1-like n=1 Tax=Thamnophis elegans TaxID=35005 RepID=UPI0013770BA8|nr:cystatin-1-like [Thamnophis elegans]
MSSRLPVPSLLGLFGALLILSPELHGYLDKPFTDIKVQNALEVAVEKYSKDRSDSANYFKVLRFLKAGYQVGGSVEVHLKVLLVKTACEKKAGWLIYRRFQECEELPGNQEVDTRDEYHLSVDLEKTTCKKDSLSITCKKQNCYFKVLSGPPQKLEITACT